MLNFRIYNPLQCVIRHPLKSFNCIDKMAYIIGNCNLIEQALYISSTALHSQFQKLSTTDKSVNKFQKSLLKYHIRSCTRCTPYGLFAGLHTATVSEQETQVVIKQEPIAKLRLDMDYLVNVYHDLCTDKALTKALTYYPNTSLYKVANKWRYHEFIHLNKRTVFNLVHIDDNIVLSKLIKVATKGISYTNCLQAITQFGFNESEAQQYLNELIQSQVLINELYPNVSGAEYQTVLFEKLSTFERYNKLPVEINTILTLNESIITKTAQVKQILTSYFNTAINESKFIQVDTLKQAIQANINQLLLPKY